MLFSSVSIRILLTVFSLLDVFICANSTTSAKKRYEQLHNLTVKNYARNYSAIVDYLQLYNGPRESKVLGFQIIYPGTKWCGAGNIAEDESDLGELRKTDSCCRSHDLCKLTIPAGGSKFGLKNPSSYTASHCTCDNQFFKCLLRESEEASVDSELIGLIYFNILDSKCFASDVTRVCEGADCRIETTYYWKKGRDFPVPSSIDLWVRMAIKQQVKDVTYIAKFIEPFMEKLSGLIDI